MWTTGEAYEQYVGRWSRIVAKEFLEQLSVPTNCRWLDVGCGTGSLTQTILRTANPQSVTGIDSSEGYVSFSRQKITDKKATFAVGDAQSLEFNDDIFDAAVSGLVINFVPDPLKAIKEMRRVTIPGGVVAVYVWDYAERMEFIRYFWDAAVSFAITAKMLDEGEQFPLCKPEPLRKLFESAGLQKVNVQPIDVLTQFRDFNDYWNPFLGGQGPAPAYAMSLTEEKRNALREYLRTKLPIANNGSITMIARAWIVRGEKY